MNGKNTKAIRRSVRKNQNKLALKMVDEMLDYDFRLRFSFAFNLLWIPLKRKIAFKIAFFKEKLKNAPVVA